MEQTRAPSAFDAKASGQLSKPCKQRTVFDPFTDFVAFGLPVLLALAFVPTWWLIPPSVVPALPWFVLVVAVDVAHVWATLFRTYLDKRELLRRPSLYLSVPAVCFVSSFVVYRLGSPRLFWTCISYAAIYHFVKQDLGLLFLYIARNSGRVTKRQVDFERVTLYVGAGCPILLWHASPPDAFHWFRGGERFLFELPAPLLVPVQMLWLGTLLAYAFIELRRWRGGAPPNVGKLFVMATSWATWAFGTLCDHEVATLAALNLFHGVPFFVMVFQYCRRRWASLEPAGCADRLTVLLTRRWYVFLLFLVALAVLEELLWDALVFQDYLPERCRAWSAHAWGDEGSNEGTPPHGASSAGVCAWLWGPASETSAGGSPNSLPPPPPPPLRPKLFSLGRRSRRARWSSSCRSSRRTSGCPPAGCCAACRSGPASAAG